MIQHTQMEQLQQLADAVPDALVIISSAGRICMVNRQTEAMFGYTRAELLEQPLGKLLPARFRLRHEELVSTYFASPHVRRMGNELDLLALNSGGQEFPVEISLSPFVVNFDAPYALAAIRDLSRRKLLEAALAESERRHQELIATVAHELRTPLAAVRGFVDTLLLQTARGNGPPLAGWQTDALGEIGQASDRLQQVTTGLLDVARLHAGLLQIRREPHDLAALVRRVTTRLRSNARTHQLRVRARQEPLVVNIDAARLEQVLVQLVTNAVTYSPNGGAISITLSSSSLRRQVKLQVRDRGIGIPRPLQRKLFTPFSSIATPVSLGGLGMGLYLAKEIVKQHGGDMGVISSPGKGSVFWLTLPLPQDESS